MSKSFRCCAFVFNVLDVLCFVVMDVCCGNLYLFTYEKVLLLGNVFFFVWGAAYYLPCVGQCIIVNLKLKLRSFLMMTFEFTCSSWCNGIS